MFCSPTHGRPKAYSTLAGRHLQSCGVGLWPAGCNISQLLKERYVMTGSSLPLLNSRGSAWLPLSGRVP
jgi:hypothetical protein